MGSTQQDFEAYSKRKLEAWKTKTSDNRTAEQKAFDDYLKARGEDTKFVRRQNPFTNNYSEYVKWVGTQVNIPKAMFDPYDVKSGDHVILAGKSKDGIEFSLLMNILSRGELNDTCDVIGITTGTVGPQGPQGERGPVGPRGPQGPAGPAGGGGAGAGIELPTMSNQENPVKTGWYKMNIIDYRQLSRNPFFAVNGKRVYTRDKRVIAGTTNSTHYAGPYTGIKKGLNVNFITNGEVADEHAVIDFTSLLPDQQNDRVLLPSKKGVSATPHKVSNYGHYYIQLGSDSRGVPKNVNMDFQCFYTDEPHVKKGNDRLDRKFEFNSYNGYDLKSNGATLKDEYWTGTMFDQVHIKTGLCNLKDLKLIRADIALGITDEPHANFLYFEVPFDCDVPEIGDHQETQSSTIGGKCLTNNLSEVTVLDVEEPQSMPYFVKYITVIPNTRKDDETLPFPDRKEDENIFCFTIALNHKHAREWQDVLAQTQIIYPLAGKYSSKHAVPFGGFSVNLSDGTQIRSCHYTQIEEDANAGTYKFMTSTMGYPDITISKAQIVSVQNEF